MLQSDWLSDRTQSTIGVQWLKVVQDMATFFSFLQSFNSIKHFNGSGNLIPENTERKAYMVS